MAIIPTRISNIYASNTFGDLIRATDNLVNSFNYLAFDDWTKPTGTLILANPDNYGLISQAEAMFTDQVYIIGSGSGLTVENNAEIQKTLYLTNSNTQLPTLIASGNSYINYANLTNTSTSLTVSGNSYFSKTAYFDKISSNIIYNSGKIYSNDDIIIDGSNYSVKLQLDTLSGLERNILYTSNLFPRWQMGCDGVAETGINAGSNFYINRYNDAGTYLSTPLFIDRSTGKITTTSNIFIQTSTPSINYSTGALTVVGGVGITGNTSVGGNVNTASELQSTYPYALRSVQGNYGAVFYNDGANFYFMQTNQFDPYGGYNNFRPFLWNLSTGYVVIDATNVGATVGGLLHLNNNLILDNPYSNLITFTNVGATPPTYTTRSIGTKIVLFDALGSSSVDYAVGIDNNTLWNSVPTSGSYFKWYAGTTNIASLDGNGTLKTNGNYYINNVSPTVYFQDTDSRSAMLHCNSGLFYVLRGSSANSTTWETFDGYFPLTINLDNNDTYLGGNLYVKRTAYDVGIKLSSTNIKNETVSFQTSDSDRWILGSSSDAETGSNAGSNFFINRYSDTGTFLSSPLSINRSSGLVSINNLYVNSGIGSSTTSTGALTVNGGIGISENINTGGYIRSSSEIRSTYSYAFRSVQGNYGTMFYNDGSNFYLLQTASGDQYGAFNSYRPFYLNLSTGSVGIDGTGQGTSFGGNISLVNSTSNLLYYNNVGVNPPTVSTRSVGTKIVLFPGINASSVDFAIGIESNTLWNSIPTSGNYFRWYAGTTNIATLDGAGGLTTIGNITIDKSNTDAYLVIDANAGKYKIVQLSSNSSTRWQIGSDISETGSGNAGSNLFINRFSDTGTYLSTPFSIERSSGLVSIANLFVNSGASSSTTSTGALIVAGGIGISENVNTGGYIKTASQLISTIATGTAPLSVSSTTLVTNLNSDLLDGQHGSYYTTSIADTTTNASYYVTFAAATNSNWNNAYTSSSKLYFNPSTGILSGTSFSSLSDEKLKENFIPIINSLDIINNIKPVGFNWKDSGKKSYGVIAQEIEKILPDIVIEKDDIKSVEYQALIPFLIEAVKELSERLNKLENK